MHNHKETSRLTMIQGVVERLVRLGEIDTVFRDIYLYRAKTLVAEWLNLDTYRILKREKSNLAHMPDQIRLAMEKGSWHEVRDLSERMKALQATVSEKQTLLVLGDQLYGSDQVPIDPFSPGLQGLAGVPPHALPSLREEVLTILQELTNEDADWQSFYPSRKKVFQQLGVDLTGDLSGKPSSWGEAQLQEKAAEALKDGDLDVLADLAQRLAQGQGSGTAVTEETLLDNPLEHDFLYKFPAETVQRASRLGLVPAHVESWTERMGHVCRIAHRYAWSPALAHNLESHNGAVRLPTAELPKDTPEGLKKRMELFVLHPMINSGGARFLPFMTAEDFLVEDFADPIPGEPFPVSDLLTALELPRRNQLTRQRIEEALRLHGARILEEELQLDPRKFRLVCIPADLHLRYGLDRGWGKQAIWTHFDGYLVMQDRHLRPLAGGDVRFGGIYDMVSIGQNYESDRVFARFAVVGRERLAAW